VKGLIGLKR
jgi:Ca2+-binding EF-hand superfamily protein